MRNVTIAAFFDELEKIGNFPGNPPSMDSSNSEQSTGTAGTTPTRPGEVKPPITPAQMKPKVINPSSGRGTNYTRSNVEAPGTDISLTQRAKFAPVPPVRV